MYRKGITLPIPDNEVQTRCRTCNEGYEDAATSRRLDDAQAQLFRNYASSLVRGYVAMIKRSHKGIAMTEIADTLGVTYPYCAQIVEGKVEPPLVFLHLLHAVAVYPELFSGMFATRERPITGPFTEEAFPIPPVAQFVRCQSVIPRAAQTTAEKKASASRARRQPLKGAK